MKITDSCRMAMHVSSPARDEVRLVYRGAHGQEVVELPGSKSIAARALILSFIYHYLGAIGSGVHSSVKILNEPACSDTEELRGALSLLEKWKKTGEVYRYDLGSGGTSLRFFLALVASLPGFEGIIDCSAAMSNRPLTPLLEALRAAGAHIEGEQPPYKVKGRRLSGKNVKVDSSVSSQFVSALMMASLLWSDPFIENPEEIVSRPYIEMTRVMISRFKEIAAKRDEDDTVPFEIEGDWSAAGFFYEFALINPGGQLYLRPLADPACSLQGDAVSLKLFGKFGVESERVESLNGVGYKIRCGNKTRILQAHEDEPVKFNLRHAPDLVPALAVGLCMAGIRFIISGIGHLRYKESNRIDTLKTELAKVGYQLISGQDWLGWSGLITEAQNEREPIFDSHNDHRIAMALAMTTPHFDSVTITGARAIEKSYTDFLSEISKIGIVIKN